MNLEKRLQLSEQILPALQLRHRNHSQRQFGHVDWERKEIKTARQR
jgi:hypothetical protein